MVRAIPRSHNVDFTQLPSATFLQASRVVALLQDGTAEASAQSNEPESLEWLATKLLGGLPPSRFLRPAAMTSVAKSFLTLLRRDVEGHVVAMDSTTAVIESGADQTEVSLKVIRWVGMELMTEEHSSSRPTLKHRAHSGCGFTLPVCFATQTFPNRLEWSEARSRYELPLDGNWQWTAWPDHREDLNHRDDPSFCFRSPGVVHDAIKRFVDRHRSRNGRAASSVHANHARVFHTEPKIGTCLIEMVFTCDAVSLSQSPPSALGEPKAIIHGGPLDSAGCYSGLHKLSTTDDCFSWTIKPAGVSIGPSCMV